MYAYRKGASDKKICVLLCELRESVVRRISHLLYIYGAVLRDPVNRAQTTQSLLADILDCLGYTQLHLQRAHCVLVLLDLAPSLVVDAL